VNPVTGKPVGTNYAARTIDHRLSVLFGFYERACAPPAGALSIVKSSRGSGPGYGRGTGRVATATAHTITQR
jgi:hypothetical protein